MYKRQIQFHHEFHPNSKMGIGIVLCGDRRLGTRATPTILPTAEHPRGVLNGDAKNSYLELSKIELINISHKSKKGEIQCL